MERDADGLGIQPGQVTDAAQLLARVTAGQYVFNGTALALEQADQAPPAPQVLKKLQDLAGEGIVTLEGEGAATQITAFDLRALEHYASKDIINGLDALTGLQFELMEGEEETPAAKRRMSYRGPVSPAQLARLYRLRVRHDISIQMIEEAEDMRDRKVAVTVNDIDANALAQEVEAEARYRDEGQDVAQCLSDSTGQRWQFDGLNVMTELPIEQIGTEYFYQALELLAHSHAIECEMISTKDVDGHDHRYCYIMAADLLKLRETSAANRDEAAAILNRISGPAQGWGTNEGPIRRPMPQDPQVEAHLSGVLGQLERAGAIRWHLTPAPSYPYGVAQIDHIDIGKLREQVPVIEAMQEPAKTVQLRELQYGGMLKDAPVRADAVWHRPF